MHILDIHVPEPGEHITTDENRLNKYLRTFDGKWYVSISFGLRLCGVIHAQAMEAAYQHFKTFNSPPLPGDKIS